MRADRLRFVVANPDVELSDEAISAFARLLLELISDQKDAAEETAVRPDINCGQKGVTQASPGDKHVKRSGPKKKRKQDTK